MAGSGMGLPVFEKKLSESVSDFARYGIAIKTHSALLVISATMSHPTDEQILAAINALDDDALLDAMRDGSVYMVSVERLAPERLSEHMCLECVRQNGDNLRFVPATVRSTAFDRSAALASGWAFGYLNPVDKTEAFLLEVMASRNADVDVAVLGEEWAVRDSLLASGAVVAAAIKKFGAREVQKWLGKRNPPYFIA